MITPETLVPALRLADVAVFAVYVVAAVVVPGWCLCRLAGLHSGRRWERWALIAVLGILWSSWTYFCLGLTGYHRWHVPVVWLPLAWQAVRWGRARLRGSGRHSAGSAGGAAGRLARRWLRPWDAAQLVSLGVIALLVLGYLGRVSALVRPDRGGLRLYGAFYSDKLTNMSPCAALLHGVPPDSLRLSGHAFPSHYFPHMFVAAAARATGIDYLNLFWYHAAALGIIIKAMAVVAFCRRAFRARWVACAAVTVWGLCQIGPEERSLDVSLALLLLGMLALGRFRHCRRRRWVVLAVGLIAAMPCYEVFYAAAALGGLIVWWTAGVVRATAGRFRERPGAAADARSRRRGVADDGPRPDRWRELRMRTAVAGAACVAAALVIRVLYLGAELVSRPKVVWHNSYRDSYKHEWRDLLRDSAEEHPILHTLYCWKRGKPYPSVEQSEYRQPVASPGPLRRIVGEIVYDTGFVGYVFVRFVNLAVFGVAALGMAYRFRTARWGTIEALVASIAAVGFGVPMFLSWGRIADGQWWETPNIYRLTTLAHTLLILVGVGVVVHVVRHWHRVRYWPALGIVGWQAWTWLVGFVTPVTMYHLVPPERLEALAFLRTEVPYGEVVIHPWVDDLIRDSRQPAKVAWVYKGHFTLGSNLAGQQMYYEGRQDHLFINGFVSPNEVSRRSRLRQRFYDAPTAEVVAEVIDQGKVRWVVADDEHPAPPPVAGGWDLAFAGNTVRVYRRPSAGARSVRPDGTASNESMSSMTAGAKRPTPAAGDNVIPHELDGW